VYRSDIKIERRAGIGVDRLGYNWLDIQIIKIVFHFWREREIKVLKQYEKEALSVKKGEMS
jgi:hypothetical protein